MLRVIKICSNNGANRGSRTRYLGCPKIVSERRFCLRIKPNNIPVAGNLIYGDNRYRMAMRDVGAFLLKPKTKTRMDMTMVLSQTLALELKKLIT